MAAVRPRATPGVRSARSRAAPSAGDAAWVGATLRAESHHDRSDDKLLEHVSWVNCVPHAADGGRG